MASNLCSKCAAPLPSDWPPERACPRCLMQAGATPSPEDAGSGAFKREYEPPQPAELAPFFPDLEVKELLGQGGMGAVYRARQVKLDRWVALKIFPREMGEDAAFAERFQREAKTLARLHHPSIISVFDFGEVRGLYFLILEYVEGANLRQILAEGKLSPAEALRIVPAICEALQYAHDEGIVHRDIKPENVLVDMRGRVKIADFGLAKLIKRRPGEDTLTHPQQVMGTRGYMAPEQVERPLEVDHRADIYALGVVFYEMLTGELPLGKFPLPSQKVQIDVRLDEVVLRALEKAPERRYQKASEIKTDVETIAQGPKAPQDNPAAKEAGPPPNWKAFSNAWGKYIRHVAAPPAVEKPPFIPLQEKTTKEASAAGDEKMKDGFYVIRMGKEEGPFSFVQLQDMARSKLMRGRTMLRRAEGGHWFPAKELPGIFSDRNWLILLLLSFFLGTLGIDRFYLGHIGVGIAKLLTCGGFGIWYIVDLILIVLNQPKDDAGLPLAR